MSNGQISNNDGVNNILW